MVSYLVNGSVACSVYFPGRRQSRPDQSWETQTSAALPPASVRAMGVSWFHNKHGEAVADFPSALAAPGCIGPRPVCAGIVSEHSADVDHVVFPVTLAYHSCGLLEP